jgi:hypothetical protein
MNHKDKPSLPIGPSGILFGPGNPMFEARLPTSIPGILGPRHDIFHTPNIGCKLNGEPNHDELLPPGNLFYRFK